MSDTLVPHAPLHAEAVLAQIGPSPRTRARPIYGYIHAQTANPYAGGHDCGHFTTLVSGSIVPGAITRHPIGLQGVGCDFFVFTPSSVQTLPVFIGRMEKIQRDLERLRDGWSGPGTKAPSEQTLTDFYRLVGAMPAAIRTPEVEVDDETGYITLRWSSQTIGLSFVLRGTGKALLVRTNVGQPTVVSSRTFDLGSQAHSIARYLASDPAFQDALEAA